MKPGESPRGLRARTPDGNRVLNLLNQADWKTLQLKLLEYTLFKIRRLSWRTGGSSLPKGLSAEDLVIIAIHKTFEGAHLSDPPNDGDPGGGPSSKSGVRKWNPDVVPELLSFLKSVVDSDVHHLVTSDEHRMTDFDPTGVEHERIADPGANPEAEFMDKEAPEGAGGMPGADDFDRFLRTLKEEFRDDQTVSLVLGSYEEQARRGGSIKPATVAQETGLPIREVRNAIKRMRRVIFGLQNASAEIGRKGRDTHAPV